MNTLLGLRENYVDDGRVVTQIVDSKALPNELRVGNVAQQLGDVYKQINAPFGQFASDSSSRPLRRWRRRIRSSTTRSRRRSPT